MIRFALILYLLVVLFGRALTPYDPTATQTDIALQPPTWAHPAGTDMFGRDVLSRALHGGTRTLITASISAGIAVILGMIFGLRRGDSFINGMLDALTNAALAIPGLVIALVAITLIGNNDTALIAATGIAQIAPFARLTRTVIRAVDHAGYIDAANALGARPNWVLRRHILPNIAPSLAAYACVTFGVCLLNAAALTFLGFGGEIGRVEWGAMLAEGRQAFRTAPWIAFLPGVGITVGVLLLNELADQLTRIKR